MRLLTPTHATRALKKHFTATQSLHLRDLFTQDPQRAQRFSIEVGDIFLDYSKNRITDETLRLLTALARTAGLPAAITAMFNGEKINTTEDRAVLHTALREPHLSPLYVDGVEVSSAIHQVRTRMQDFVAAVRSARWRGYSQQAITDVVNIGIGGSDLGPLMVCHALKPYSDGRLKLHFVSNIDGVQLQDIFDTVRAENTLFIIASKTFTTQETLMNAHRARQWFIAQTNQPSAIAQHFVAVSSNKQAVCEFGIDLAQLFEFWDWVGGRFSLWSAMGLPIMLSLGQDPFNALLRGAHLMDQHFLSAPLDANMPVLLALLGLWSINFYGCTSHVIAPYDQYLQRLPSFIQQLDMESNGKSLTREGRPVTESTAPIIWGETGINAQHAFFQLLHQGTHLVPIDFIASLKPHQAWSEEHAVLLANVFAQAEALMRGKTAAEVRADLIKQGLRGIDLERLVAHKTFAGNRPSNTLLLSQLDPQTLGSLIALYEHKIFVQGVIWGINSFDQWGVELGKQLANKIVAEFKQATPAVHDSSTAQLIERYLRSRNKA